MNNKSNRKPWSRSVKLFAGIAFILMGCLTTNYAAAQFTYVDNNEGVQFVTYGSSYTYSVSWTNGAYSNDGTTGTYVSELYKPSGDININALYPSTGGFTYTVPFVTSSDNGEYYLQINGTNVTTTTSPVYMYVTPGIVQQPTNTLATNNLPTTMGLVAGPSGVTYAWINAVTGSQIASSASFTVNTSMNGDWVYCKISNAYGYVITSTVQLSVAGSQFTYANNNGGVQFVPYGGSYTYSVSWTNGNYSYDGSIGTFVYEFYKPSSDIAIDALYPSTGGFTYTVPFVTSSDDGEYYLQMEGNSSEVTTAPVYMHVTPAIVQQPTNSTVASGSATTLGLVAGPSTATFTWINAANSATVANGMSFTAQSSMNGETVYCKISNSYGYVISTPVLLNVGPSSLVPFITSQPTNLTVVAGQNATFQVTAIGESPLSYAWHYNGVAISGANANFLTLSPATTNNAGLYSCTISNSYGTTNTAVVSLSFATYPVITNQPQSLVVTQGQTATFTAGAAGSPLNYYWAQNGIAIGGATDTSYTITNVTAANAGIYTLTVSNGLGSVISSGAVLTVYGPPIITAQPSNQNVTAGSNAMFSVTATGGGVNYQWYGSGTNTAMAAPFVTNGFVVGATVTYGGGGYAMIPNVQIIGGGGTGATANATLSNGVVVAINVISTGSGYTSAPAIQIDPPYAPLANQTNAVLNLIAATANEAGNYFAVVANSFGSVTSSNASLTVNAPVYITSEPQSQVVPSGGNAAFAVSVGGAPPFNYQWYYASTNQATAAALVLNGFVYGVNIVNGGANYATVPNVQLIGGGGSGAVATAVVSNGVVTAINVTQTGSGYTNAPAVQIDPPLTLLSGQINPALNLTGVTATNAGNYFVVVTNNFGSATSSLAMLTIGASGLIVPAVTPVATPNGLCLEFAGATNFPYVLQSTTNLTPPIIWQSIFTNTSGTNGHWGCMVTNNLPRCYYRIMAQ